MAENEISVEVDGVTHWYRQSEEEELRNYMSQQRTAARLNIEQMMGDFLVRGETRGPNNHSVAGRPEMHDLASPREGDRCYVDADRTTYIHDGENWIGQVNQGVLSQIENSDPSSMTLFTGRQGYEDFQRVMRETTEVSLDGVSQSIDTNFEPVSHIDISSIPEGMSAEEALRHYNQSGISFVDRRRDTQDQLTIAQYKLELAMREGVEDKMVEIVEEKEGVFLQNIER